MFLVPYPTFSSNPDPWQELKRLVLDSVTSANSRRSYEHGLTNYLEWWQAQGCPAFNKATIASYRSSLEAGGLAPATINVRMSAIRKLAVEAADNGLLAPEIASGIARARGVKQRGTRTGNWLTLAQAQELLRCPNMTSMKGIRDRAILALLLGCALRRSELAALTFEHVQQRDGRWAIVDMIGKGGRIRTVPVPAWVKVSIDEWSAISRILSGPVFRSVLKGSRVGRPLSEKTVWRVLLEYSKIAGLHPIAPHDLRRICAKLCRAAGGDLEQIQFLLGHASIQTTERYLGTEQDLAHAPNDRIRLKL
jgi:site-specific recombinase XerD